MILTKMLKGAFAAAIALFSGLTVNAQHGFTLNGRLDKSEQGQVVLFYKLHGKSTVDSAVVTNGSFTLKGEVSDPVYSVLYFNHLTGNLQERTASRDGQEFFLEGGTYNVTGEHNMGTAKITGGQSQADFRALRVQYAPFDEKLKTLQQQMANYKTEMNDTALLRGQKESAVLMKQVKSLDSVFISTHPDSYTAFDLWRKKHRGLIDLDIEASFMHFTPRIRNTEEGQILAKRIDDAKRLSPGNLAPDFTLKDTLGHPVSLSSLRGKNVLLCFWIADFGTFADFAFSMNKVNRRLRDKNFTTVSVYFDNGKKESQTTAYWKKILNDFSINSWINLSDVGGVEMNGGPISPVAKAYAIGPRTLPLLYLIGPDGKILSRSLFWYDKDVSKKIDDLIK